MTLTKTKRSNPNLKKAKPDVATMAIEEIPLRSPEADAPVIQILLSEIDLSKNYRPVYDQKALEEFAAGIKDIGFIISPVTVRVVKEGRYQLVVGYRRYNGAILAGLQSISAVVRDLNDEQVEIIQLQENIQREDSHPLYDAKAIEKLYERGHKTMDIARLLGKPVNWIYDRYKLCSLTSDFQEMFFAGVFTLSQAIEISVLPPEAQESFYSRYCSSWKQQRPTFNSLSNFLSNFRCQLSRAEFDTADASLVPEAGSCMGCRFNTAFKGLLIPDLSADAKCTRTSCFSKKRQVHVSALILKAFAEGNLTAFITYGHLSPELQKILADIPEVKDLPMRPLGDVTVVEKPEAPEIDDFSIQVPIPEYFGDEQLGKSSDEIEPLMEGNTISIDKEGFEAAQAEYQKDLKSYQDEIASGKLLKGCYLFDVVRIVYYYPVPTNRNGALKKPEKRQDITHLIAARKDTVEILQSEISRIEAREKRFLELDREKVQDHTHEMFQKSVTQKDAKMMLTRQDRVAARWLIFDGMHYDVREKVERFLRLSSEYRRKPETLYKSLEKLSDAKFSFLIRMALAGKAESKSPNSVAGHILLKVAAGAKVDIASIIAGQATLAKKRQTNQQTKITLYKSRIKYHIEKEKNAREFAEAMAEKEKEKTANLKKSKAGKHPQAKKISGKIQKQPTKQVKSKSKQDISKTKSSIRQHQRKNAA